ncbi:MAG: D-alanine--D-alanine ligase [Bacteroidetes bacterium]|nr:D-alanine--D-alanine ligase [Bacteroidota bacterium]
MKNIALVFGGFSKEAEISEKSAHQAKNALEGSDYNVYPVKISKEKWCHVAADGKEYAVDKNDFSVSIDGKKITFTKALNLIHGAPGENGVLGGYFELIGLPYTSSGVLTSALTMNKNWTTRFLSQAGIRTAPSFVVYRGDKSSEYQPKANFPCFVKPNNGGSSVGTFKVKNVDELENALKEAFKHDDEIIVEEFIEGREFTCGVMGFNGTIKALPLTEVKPKNEFFDFADKYGDDGATEETPAKLSEELTKTVQGIAEKAFKILRCRNVSRIDFIMKGNDFYLIEVNTIPGMSAKSILPQQAQAVGISFKDLLVKIIEG